MGEFIDSPFMPLMHKFPPAQLNGNYSVKVDSLGLPSEWATRAKSFVSLVTPSEAQRIIDTARFERQRPASKQRIERLAAEMVARRFIQGTQIFFAIFPDGTEALLNGQHTMGAIVLSGLHQFLTITKQPVADLEEAGRIYAVFDTHSARSMRDAMKGMGRSDDIPMAASVLAAVGVISMDFTDNSRLFIPRLDRIDNVENYRDEAELFAEAIAGAPTENVAIARRSGLLAVALYTIKHQPDMAFEFWRAFARDDGLANGNPAKALLRWCNNNIATGKVARIAHCHAAAAAWNAAFRGEKRSHLAPGKMKQIRILGTPFAEARD